MAKKLIITEKPSVAMEFAKALGINVNRKNGYIESNEWIITWCVGHLVTMSYPEKYDENLKFWRLDTLPFIPTEWKYEIIPAVQNQFNIVKQLLQREDVEEIYNAGDSGREGEYIQRLVFMMAKPNPKAKMKRVWIDSQTEEEIKRGIKEAKDLSEYDSLSDAAYLRAKEDYLIGINFSRLLSIIFGRRIAKQIDEEKVSISVGRVMTCVLGMVVSREREIANFVKTTYYKIIGEFGDTDSSFKAEWKVTEDSKMFNSPQLYNETGFKKIEDAQKFILSLKDEKAIVKEVKKTKQKENAPLLFNLAEIQNECTKRFKIKPDETLEVIQNLYEKKLVTYPRTDARVLSTAIAKEIDRNIKGLLSYPLVSGYADEILRQKMYQGIEKTKYVNDKQITDHYAIIPTGQGLKILDSMPDLQKKVYEVIVRRFLAIFYPPAVYQKVSIVAATISPEECFYTNNKILVEKGFLPVSEFSFKKKKENTDNEKNGAGGNEEQGEGADSDSNPDSAEDAENVQTMTDEEFAQLLKKIKTGSKLTLKNLNIKEGETSPPKRYNSGQMILAMENAGQLIEDEDLRAQIKGSGIGTSATRAEILKKLVNIEYIRLNKKTQIYTPSFVGEAVYEVVNASIRSMLNPELTASWELGLSQVAEGTITEKEYMDKLESFVRRNVDYVKGNNYSAALRQRINAVKKFYTK